MYIYKYIYIYTYNIYVLSGLVWPLACSAWPACRPGYLPWPSRCPALGWLLALVAHVSWDLSGALVHSIHLCSRRGSHTELFTHCGSPALDTVVRPFRGGAIVRSRHRKLCGVSWVGLTPIPLARSHSKKRARVLFCFFIK